MSESSHFSWPSPGQGVSSAALKAHWHAEGVLRLCGAPGSTFAWALANLQQTTGRPVVVMTETAAAAVVLKRDLRYLACRNGQTEDVMGFAHYETSPWDQVVPDRQATMRRMHTLVRLVRNDGWRFLILSADAMIHRQIPPERLAQHCLHIRTGERIERSFLSSWLDRSGYRIAPLVEEPGNCAVRGFIVDIFIPGTAHPFRIELFGDIVESIREFRAETQETVTTREDVLLHPARQIVIPPGETERTTVRDRLREIADAVNLPTGRVEILINDVIAGHSFAGAHGFVPAFEPLMCPITAFFPDNAIVAAEDPAAVLAACRQQCAHLKEARDQCVNQGHPAFPFSALMVDADEIESAVRARATVQRASFSTLFVSRENDDLQPPEIDLNGRDFAQFGDRLRRASTDAEIFDVMDPLVDVLQRLVDEGYRVVVVSHTQGHGERLEALFRSRDIGTKTCQGVMESLPPGIFLDVGELARGGLIPAEALCFITEEEIFGHRVRATKRKGRSSGAAADLRMLQPGDLVVHREHGIGKYLGLVRQKVRGAEMDFLLITYRNNDKLYLPVYRLSAIQKYQSASESTPSLDRLGGQTFSVSRATARKRAMEMAARLLDIYARRNLARRDPMLPADDLFREFEAAFPYEETPDQLQVIEEVLSDLEAERPMDRLVCGDVGFGKTEIAMRAAFRVVMSGYQVAILVPTTVLAQQHYESIRRRFARWPVTVRTLSRFRTQAGNAETVSALKAGRCDIVVGTHRLLSADVHFKKLGLLVIDEEHRFGVGHKERIRALKASVDTLAMTATPIPRTLHMALVRLRDLSCISTPPLNRLPIRTMICHDDDAVIRQAIARELGREGQVYFVHNRVRGIQRVADRIRALVPTARVAVGHGQMNEHALEAVMLDFIEGRIDVLVSTAIIESGLDIPRANTILIDRADTMGLAQLYQMRGRVGRSEIQAFAFLIVPPVEILSDDARRRVEALTRYTELGSGFSLASLDLEIRGAGNLLGAEQSGDASLVGFEMFMELLDEATQVLQGRVPEPPVEPEITLDTPGFIDAFYIPEVGQRLQYYKRLSSALNEPEIRDIAAELIDRFGPLPVPADQLIDGMTARALCRELAIAGLDANASRMVLHLDDRTRLDPTALLDMVRRHPSQIRFSQDFRLQVTFASGEPTGAGGAIRFLQKLRTNALRPQKD